MKNNNDPLNLIQIKGNNEIKTGKKFIEVFLNDKSDIGQFFHEKLSKIKIGNNNGIEYLKKLQQASINESDYETMKKMKNTIYKNKKNNIKIGGSPISSRSNQETPYQFLERKRVSSPEYLTRTDKVHYDGLVAHQLAVQQEKNRQTYQAIHNGVQILFVARDVATSQLTNLILILISYLFCISIFDFRARNFNTMKQRLMTSINIIQNILLIILIYSYTNQAVMEYEINNGVLDQVRPAFQYMRTIGINSYVDLIPQYVYVILSLNIQNNEQRLQRYQELKDRIFGRHRNRINGGKKTRCKTKKRNNKKKSRTKKNQRQKKRLYKKSIGTTQFIFNT